MALSNRTVTNQASGYNSSNTISHTPAGTPSVAYAIVTFAEGGVLGSAPTYAGATMTLVGQATGSTPRNDVSVWRKTSPASGTQNCVVPANAGSYSYATVVTYEGSDTSTPDSGLVTNNTTGGQSAGISSATGDEVLFGFSTHFGSATSGGSVVDIADAYGWGGTVEQHLAGYVPGATTSTVVITAGSEETSFVAFNVKAAGASATLEQEGFRWYEDNGSESGSSAAANQDTNITAAAGSTKRLRMLVNATGDPATKQFKLQWKKSGGSWADVL